MGKIHPTTAKRPARIEGTAGLARHLGLSRWTVSRVLNGHSGVKEETRKRVLEAVEELGFEPNKLARGLRGGPSGLIGVSFPYLEATVLAEKSRVLKNALGEAGYRGIFEIPEGDPEAEADVIRHFLSINVDGIVLIASKLGRDNPVLEEVRQRGVGLVAVDATNSLPVMRVQLDRQEAMRKVLKHLHELGHRKIALLGLGSDDMYRADRLKGLKAGCRDLGMNFERNLLFIDEEGYSWRDYSFGALLGKKVLEFVGERPTALVCLNDCLAISAMRALQEAGKTIPGDYSVVGFDNTPESQWGYPSLTSVDQNISSLMDNAKKLLWDSLNAKGSRLRKVKPKLFIRGSTGPIPVA
ncbi:MAG: LacI family DNA-binding transcriptional regulator [Puniceicoccaceae bacterium]